MGSRYGGAFKKYPGHWWRQLRTNMLLKEPWISLSNIPTYALSILAWLFWEREKRNKPKWRHKSNWNWFQSKLRLTSTVLIGFKNNSKFSRSCTNIHPQQNTARDSRSWDIPPLKKVRTNDPRTKPPSFRTTAPNHSTNYADFDARKILRSSPSARG